MNITLEHIFNHLNHDSWMKRNGVHLPYSINTSVRGQFNKYPIATTKMRWWSANHKCF